MIPWHSRDFRAELGRHTEHKGEWKISLGCHPCYGARMETVDLQVFSDDVALFFDQWGGFGKLYIGCHFNRNRFRLLIESSRGWSAQQVKHCTGFAKFHCTRGERLFLFDRSSRRQDAFTQTFIRILFRKVRATRRGALTEKKEEGVNVIMKTLSRHFVAQANSLNQWRFLNDSKASLFGRRRS